MEIHNSYSTLNKEPFVFIDEAQFDKKWVLTGKVLYDEYKKLFLVFTGSSTLDLENTLDLARRVDRFPIIPLNFSEYLNLKYKFPTPKNLNINLQNLIFNKISSFDYELLLNQEAEFYKSSLILEKPLGIEFKTYLKSGGFPFILNNVNFPDKILEMLEKVIDNDMDLIKPTTYNTKSIAYKIIRILALQNPGPISEVNLANDLDESPATVRNILDTFLKTHLIFPLILK